MSNMRDEMNGDCKTRGILNRDSEWTFRLKISLIVQWETSVKDGERCGLPGAAATRLPVLVHPYQWFSSLSLPCF